MPKTRFIAALIIAILVPLRFVWRVETKAFEQELSDPVFGILILLLLAVQSLIGSVPGCIAYRRRIYDQSSALRSIAGVSWKAGLVGAAFALWLWLPTKVTTSHSHRPDLWPYVIRYSVGGALWSGLTAAAFAAGFGQNDKKN